MDISTVRNICKHLDDMNLVDFLPMQGEGIVSIQDGNDTLVILPPGSGKSLIFQIPARLRIPDLTVVISPLIVLMDDQVRKINGLRAAQLHSNLERNQRSEILEKVGAGEIDLLYISPEGLSAKTVLECISQRKVSLLVIDEVHCVSLWGHSFRPSYLFINEIRRQFGNPQLAMFTATAPPHVIEDVKRILGIKNVVTLTGEPFRDNIKFEVIRIEDRSEKIAKLDEIILANQQGSIIIYASTIKQVCEAQEQLSKKHAVAIYHGQMEPKQRRKNYELFMSGECRLIVCTSAFGMGIDKPDIYTIVHYSVPGSLEDYIQESGRAGRDGSPSLAVVFDCRDDYSTQRMFAHGENPSPRRIKAVYDFLLDRSKRVSEYQNSPVSYAQLTYFLNDYLKNQPWLKSAAYAAIATLIDHGHIVRDGDEILFPSGDDLQLDETMIRNKFINRLKRLQLLMDCVRSDNFPNEVRRYFKTNVFNEITLNKWFADPGIEHILGFITRYHLSTSDMIKVLTGDAGVSDKDTYGSYYGVYMDVYPDHIRQLIFDLVEKRCIHPARISQIKTYFLGNLGEAYLLQKNIDLPILESVFDVHHHSNREEIIHALRCFESSREGYNEGTMVRLPALFYEEFLKNTIRIGQNFISGKKLVSLYAFGKEPTLIAFKQMLHFFFEINEDEENKKAKMRKIRNRRHY